MNKLLKDGKELLYKVEEKNIKHSYIKPKNGYILITKSKTMKLSYVIKRIENDFNYYYKLVKRVEEDILSLWGKAYKVKLSYAKKFNYVTNEDVILVSYKNEEYLEIKKLILANELKVYLESIYEEVNKNLYNNNYYEVPIQIKLLKSKYGSYNVSKGSEYIVLNSFLATQEKEFTKYVLYHEYAHQKHKNHQKGFYDALDKLYKDHLIYQKKIKKIKLSI